MDLTKQKTKRFRWSRYLSLGLWITLGVVGGFVTGQEPPGQKQAPALRELQVIITDNKGHSLSDVTQNDIRVTEDSAPQTVESFSLLETPVRYGLLIDSTGSLRSQFPRVIESATDIINSNQPNDETFLVRFIDSKRIDIIQETTTDKFRLTNALSTLRIEQGQTAVIDAVYASANVLQKTIRSDPSHARRNALVLITDGEDRWSSVKAEDLFKFLSKVNLKIFVIGLVEELDKEGGIIRPASRDRATQLIERLAKETGGRAFFPSNRDDFPKVVSQITHDLHQQYVLRYRAASGAGKSTHKIEIKVSDSPDKKNRRAILRPKYDVEILDSK